MADETEDDVEVEVEDEAEAEPEEETEAKPPPKPAAKPGKGKPAKTLPPRGEKVEVDARGYAKKLDRLTSVEAELAEIHRARAEREKAKTQPVADAPPKDWQRFLSRRDAAHQAEIEAVAKERDTYREALKSDIHRREIRSAIDEWDRKNPTRTVRPNMRDHLVRTLVPEFGAEWDEDEKQFVLIDPRTDLPARDVVHKLLGSEDYAGFLNAATAPGSGARNGARRPGAGSERPADGEKKKGTGNVIMDNYRARQAAFSSAGARPSIGLRVSDAMSKAHDDN